MAIRKPKSEEPGSYVALKDRQSKESESITIDGLRPSKVIEILERMPGVTVFRRNVSRSVRRRAS